MIFVLLENFDVGVGIDVGVAHKEQHVPTSKLRRLATMKVGGCGEVVVVKDKRL